MISIQNKMLVAPDFLSVNFRRFKHSWETGSCSFDHARAEFPSEFTLDPAFFEGKADSNWPYRLYAVHSLSDMDGIHNVYQAA